MTTKTKTANAYIDGFNFYHGSVKLSPALKWLDLDALCESLLRGYQLVRVSYYTARVRDQPNDPAQSQRQDDYLRALGSRPRIEIVFGQFQKKKSTVVLPPGTTVELTDGSQATLAAGQMVRGRTWEEKGSDVNLGTDLSWDAATGTIGAALVISNDLDLQRPITRAIATGVEVIVVNPHQRTNRRPSLQGSDTRNLKRGDLRRCQFPDEVTLADGQTVVRRPASWR